MNRDGQAQFVRNGDIARREDTFEQQDRLLPPQLAHTDGFVEVEQCDAIGIGEARIDALDSMPIGVCLDDGPNPRARGHLPDQLKIVSDGIRVNAGNNRAGHRSPLRK